MTSLLSERADIDGWLQEPLAKCLFSALIDEGTSEVVCEVIPVELRLVLDGFTEVSASAVLEKIYSNRVEVSPPSDIAELLQCYSTAKGDLTSLQQQYTSGITLASIIKL